MLNYADGREQGENEEREREREIGGFDGGRRREAVV